MMHIKFAVAQFGRANEPRIKAIANEVTKDGVHWYQFDRSEDRESALQELCRHYDIVYECKGPNEFEEVKFSEKDL